MALTIEERIRVFRGLNGHNDQALEELAKLQASHSAPKDAITQLFESIGHMRGNLECLLPSESDFYKNGGKEEYKKRFADRVSQVQAKAQRRTPNLSTTRPMSPHVLSSLAHATVGWLSFLDPRLEGSFSPDDITIDDLVSPHDLIRYMHQVGVDIFFNPNGSKWDTESPESFTTSYESEKMVLYIISTSDTTADKYLEEDPFLCRFKDIIDSKKFDSKSRYTDNFYILVDDTNMSIQMPLGCHFATLKIRKEREGYEFRFKFTNTKRYSSSKFRGDVTNGILSNMGYEIERKKHIIDASLNCATEEESVDKFESLIRLAVSLHNIDTFEKRAKRRKKDTIQAFEAGVINLCGYIRSNKKGTYETYAKAQGTFLGDEPTEKKET